MFKLKNSRISESAFSTLFDVSEVVSENELAINGGEQQGGHDSGGGSSGSSYGGSAGGIGFSSGGFSS